MEIIVDGRNNEYDTGFHPEVQVMRYERDRFNDFFKENRFPNLRELCAIRMQSLEGLCHPTLRLFRCVAGNIPSLCGLNCPNLDKLVLYSCRLKTIEGCACDDSISCTSTYRKINCPYLRCLDLTCNQLTSARILDCPLLEKLYLESNNIVEFDINCPRLFLLKLKNNKLNSFVLDHTKLESLNLEYNNIIEFNINCPLLTVLNIDCNNIKSLALKQIKLESLKIYCNNLEHITISCPLLKKLDVGQKIGVLKSLDLTECPQLENLKTDLVNVQNLNGLEFCTNLRIISIGRRINYDDDNYHRVISMIEILQQHLPNLRCIATGTKNYDIIHLK
jgi:hypothetical protein